MWSITVLLYQRHRLAIVRYSKMPEQKQPTEDASGSLVTQGTRNVKVEENFRRGRGGKGP